MRKRLKVGDVVEMRTKNGCAYLLYTHKHPMYGQLVRVFSELHANRPDNVQVVLSGNVQFSAFFPLQYAVSKQICEIVDNVEIPRHLQDFPVFRGESSTDRNGKVLSWYSWDGNSERELGSNLSASEKRLPILEILNDTALVERIEDGWRPEDDS